MTLGLLLTEGEKYTNQTLVDDLVAPAVAAGVKCMNLRL